MTEYSSNFMDSKGLQKDLFCMRGVDRQVIQECPGNKSKDGLPSINKIKGAMSDNSKENQRKFQTSKTALLLICYVYL